MCVQACCGSLTSATRGCRCWDSWWQRQAADVIDMSESRQPEDKNPPCPQAYKYQHATGWTQSIRQQPCEHNSRSQVSAPSPRLPSDQMLRPSCVLSVLVLQLLLDQTCSAVLPSRNERVRVAASACQKPDLMAEG